MQIEARGITKRFGPFRALDDVSVVARSGRLVALLGPSGSGKTTLLRIIGGLEQPDAGAVLLGGEDATLMPVARRRVGFVFQHYALFEHMTVEENVAFGLRVRPRPRPPEAAIGRRVGELLELVQLAGLGRRRPRQLSGGQRQRVALARALAIEPRVLLLDEPFGALDAQVRQELRRWLMRLHEQVPVTTLFVTHDQAEAFEIADEVVLMREGRVEQVGTPDELYERPASPFAFEFLGGASRLPAVLDAGRLYVAQASFAAPAHGDAREREARLYVRAQGIDLARERLDESSLAVTVRRVHLVGPRVRIELACVDVEGSLEAELSREQLGRLEAAVGERLYARLRRPRAFVGDVEVGLAGSAAEAPV
ncbi:MAG TPA: TOBE-like domain-containing protein [Chloroflexota bacterium]|jgi:sulfate transport system ATP-binding protein